MKERRMHPRFDVILPVRIDMQGTVEEGNIFDISHGGVQIGCEEQAALNLLTDINEVTPSNPVPVSLTFKLPSGLEDLQAEAFIVVCRRVAADEFRLGLEFSEMGDAHIARLDAYIAQRMKEG
jgi:c-di-GMP-binding flagellar brake protein YcgR